MRLIIPVCCALLIPNSAWGAYRLTDLGSLGGTHGTSSAAALTDDGVVVGETQIGVDTHAFIWVELNGMGSLGTVSGAGNSYAYDVERDQSGELSVVGRSGQRPFHWSPSSGTVQMSANVGSANGVNRSRNAIGTREISDGTHRAFRYAPPNTVNIPYVTTRITGVAINDQNEYVGAFDASSNGYISNGGAIFQAIHGFLPTDINNSRLIVGSVGADAALYEFTTESLTTIGKLNPNDTSARGLGINNAGIVVGESVGTGAFLYNPTTTILHDLTAELAPQFAGWTVTVADDINENGWIVGDGVLNGVTHAVLLRPIEAGDFDANGVVDAADLSVWSESYGVGQAGDANSDGVTDGADFLVWQLNLGVGLPPSTVTIPEPGSVVIVALLVALHLTTARRRH